MNWFKKHKVLSGVLGFILLIIIIGAASGGDTNTPTNSTQANSETTQTAENKPAENKEPAVPAEYKSALAKAESYANTQHMSKKGLYDQLTSEYGEKFTAAEADYAIAHLND